MPKGMAALLNCTDIVINYFSIHHKKRKESWQNLLISL